MKKRERNSRINSLASIRFIVILSLSIVGTIWAVYLESILHNPSYVGFLTSFFTIAGIIGYFFAINIMQKDGEKKAYFFSMIFICIILFLFGIIKNIWIIAILGALWYLIGSIRITAFGIMVANNSKRKELSKNEGKIYAIVNIAWVIGPLLAGFIADKLGYSKLFFISATIMLIAIIIFNLLKIKKKEKTRKPEKIIKTFFEFFKNKKRLASYFLSGGINFWWTLLYIYIPILIINSGLTNKTVGLFIFAVAVPTVIFEIPFGKLAGKIGFKKMFVLGYSILAFSALVCFFITNIYTILIILILSSIGAAMVEPTTEAYFFDIIKESEREKYYPPYNSTIDLNVLLSSLSAALILLLFPFRSIFILFGVAMVIMVLLSVKMKNLIEAKRKD